MAIKQEEENVISRRKVIEAIAGVPVSLAMPGIVSRARATSELSIAGLYSLSGNFANVSTQMNQGSSWAIEQYGTAAGNKLKYLLQDDRGDVGEAVRKTYELISVQGIKHLIGAGNSAAALAIQREANVRGGLYIHQAGADEATGKDCNRSTFRWTAACYSAINATVRPLIDRFPDAKKWYTITGQYVFGDSLLSNCKSVFAEKGIKHVGNSYHSLSDREYSGHIANAIAAAPDVVAVCNFGNQTLDVIRQAISYGMKRNTKILAVWSTGLDQFRALGQENCEGIYFGCNYWHDIDTPGNRRLREIVKQKSGDVPTYLQASGYAIAQMMIEGISKANSIEVNEVIRALEGLTYEGPTGTETIRPGDHQVIKDYYLMLGKAKAAMKDKDDCCDVLTGSKEFQAVEKTGCRLTG